MAHPSPMPNLICPTLDSFVLLSDVTIVLVLVLAGFCIRERQFTKNVVGRTVSMFDCLRPTMAKVCFAPLPQTISMQSRRGLLNLLLFVVGGSLGDACKSSTTIWYTFQFVLHLFPTTRGTKQRTQTKSNECRAWSIGLLAKGHSPSFPPPIET